MVFTTLLYREDLSAAELARANALVSVGDRLDASGQSAMVVEAGWKLVAQRDTTSEYLGIVRRDLEAFEARLPRAEQALGAAETDARRQHKRRYLEAVEDGLLRRGLFVLAAAV